MTAVCVAGGPSAAKPGYASLLYIGPAAIGALFNNIPTPWAVAVAAYIGAITYDLSTFCTTDAPTLPTFTWPDDLLNAIQIADPVAHVAAIKKFEDLAGYYFWSQFCQCTSGATPAPSAPPTGPGTSIDVNPYTTCLQMDTGVLPFPASGGPIAVFPPGYNTTTGLPALALPVGATSVHVVTTSIVFGATHTGTRYRLNWRSNTALITPSAVIDVASGATDTRDVAVPVGATSWNLENSSGPGGVGTDKSHMVLSFSCSPDPTGGCCPPDPTIASTVAKTLELVTLLQRQLAPFATVHGAAHTGLSGAGQIAVSGLIGVAVDLTTTPGRVGLVAGDPDTVFDVGWINVGTADGWGPRHFITSDPFVLTPVSGDVTLIGYSLPADVVATITELVREP